MKLLGRLATVIGAFALALTSLASAEDSADLEISVSAVFDPAVAGRVQIYDVEIVNRGPATAQDVLFDYEPAAQAWLAGVRPTGGSCSITGRSLACDLGALAAEEEARLSVGIYVDSRLDGLLSASALASSTTADPNETNNEATAETPTIRARSLTAIRRADGSDLLVASLKESDTTIGLVFIDPSGEERSSSVSSPGYRAVALTQVVSSQGSDRVAALGYGFDDSAVLDIVDLASTQSVARHPLREGLVPIDLVSIPLDQGPRPDSGKRAGTSAPALAVLAFDPSSSTTCLIMIDTRTGAKLRSLCTPGTTEGEFPIGLTLLGDGSRLAVLTSSLTTSALHSTTTTADAWEDPLVLPGEGLPLDLEASEHALLVLNRGPDGGSITRVRFADTASFTSTRHLERDVPEALAPLTSASDEAPDVLAVAGREGEALWLETVSQGGLANGLAVGEDGAVCLGLVGFRRPGDSESGHLALLYERPGHPTEVALFDLDRFERSSTYVLP